MSDLPDSEEVRTHFGVWHPQSGGVCAKARVSQLFDVLNKVTIDAIIASKSYGERALAERHLDYVGKRRHAYCGSWLSCLLVLCRYFG